MTTTPTTPATADQATATAVNGRTAATITLQTPIVRSGQTIKELRILKPRTGDLRGLMLAELLQLKADAVATLLPRITVPTLVKAEVDEMDAADLVSCSVEVATFLMPKAALESLPA